MKLKTWIFIFFSSLSLLLAGQNNFKESSVLKSGKWYKIKIEHSGVYKISYEDLISLGFSTPDNIRVYGQSGEQLSFFNESNFADDLEEIPLYASKSDNFGPGDYYLFYGEGVETTYYDEIDSIYRQKIHNYALYNYYFLTTSFGSGKRIEEVNTGSLVSNLSQNSYDWVGYYEEENHNLIKSGRQWFSELLSGKVGIKVDLTDTFYRIAEELDSNRFSTLG